MGWATAFSVMVGRCFKLLAFSRCCLEGLAVARIVEDDSSWIPCSVFPGPRLNIRGLVFEDRSMGVAVAFATRRKTSLTEWSCLVTFLSSCLACHAPHLGLRMRFSSLLSCIIDAGDRHTRRRCGPLSGAMSGQQDRGISLAVRAQAKAICFGRPHRDDKGTIELSASQDVSVSEDTSSTWPATKLRWLFSVVVSLEFLANRLHTGRASVRNGCRVSEFGVDADENTANFRKNTVDHDMPFELIVAVAARAVKLAEA